MRHAVLLITLTLVAVVTAARPASAAETFTYDIDVQGDVDTDRAYFAQIARLTFTDDRGWNLGGSIDFEPVSSGADFDLILASPEVVDNAAPGCSAQYSCTVGNDVYVNDDNFQNATPAWRDSRRSLRSYQSYVILHEVGHWLGLDHYDDCPDGTPAPVMLQQSISLDGCIANTWPLREERQQVADRFGERILDGDRYPSPLGEATFHGDWDGDGHDEPGRFEDGHWWLAQQVDAEGEVVELDYGRDGDIPVVGDWDGDGDDTIGVVRGNTWILRNDYYGNKDDIVLRYGEPDDTPVTGDWDGDGDDTIGVVRGSTWILRNGYYGNKDDIVLRYGAPTDIPVTGDWDGDGDDTLGVVRRNLWIVRNGYYGDKDDIVLRYGYQVDSPVTGDFDGDGDDTLGVVRDAHLWILRNQYSRPHDDLVFSWRP